MVSQHLKETLDKYHVGDKLRQLRLRRKMGLVELSRHTGLSPALLSKLEHGKLYPTLPTLSRERQAGLEGRQRAGDPGGGRFVIF
jgi:predicted transcriptional regulator